MQRSPAGDRARVEGHELDLAQARHGDRRHAAGGREVGHVERPAAEAAVRERRAAAARRAGGTRSVRSSVERPAWNGEEVGSSNIGVPGLHRPGERERATSAAARPRSDPRRRERPSVTRSASKPEPAASSYAPTPRPPRGAGVRATSVAAPPAAGAAWTLSDRRAGRARRSTKRRRARAPRRRRRQRRTTAPPRAPGRGAPRSRAATHAGGGAHR